MSILWHFDAALAYADAVVQQRVQQAAAIAAAQHQARLAEMAASHMFRKPGDIIDVEARVIEDVEALPAPLKLLGKVGE